MNLALQVRRGVDNAVQVHTTETLYDGCNVAVGQCQQFHDLCIYAKFIQVFLLWMIHFGIFLRDDTDDCTTPFGLLYKGLTGFAPNEDGHDHPREKHDIADG